MPESGPNPQNDPLPSVERVEHALLEATRDLKVFFAREVDAKLSIAGERTQRQLDEIDANLRGIHAKLSAIREEFHQSVRDQTYRLTVLGFAAVFCAVGLILLVARWWR